MYRLMSEFVYGSIIIVVYSFVVFGVVRGALTASSEHANTHSPIRPAKPCVGAKSEPEFLRAGDYADLTLATKF